MTAKIGGMDRNRPLNQEMAKKYPFNFLHGGSIWHLFTLYNARIRAFFYRKGEDSEKRHDASMGKLRKGLEMASGRAGSMGRGARPL